MCRHHMYLPPQSAVDSFSTNLERLKKKEREEKIGFVLLRGWQMYDAVCSQCDYCHYYGDYPKMTPIYS